MVNPKDKAGNAEEEETGMLGNQGNKQISTNLQLHQDDKGNTLTLAPLPCRQHSLSGKAAGLSALPCATPVSHK